MSKKKIIVITTFLILIILTISLSMLIMKRLISKRNFEKSIISFSQKNEEEIFKIEKITFFSSCDVQNKTATANTFTIENLYQYTDMAFFITSPNEQKDLNNTLKKVYIDNIKYEKKPEIGEQKIYYKNINHFAKSGMIKEENLISERIDFETTSKDEANLEYPVLYNNLANPIVLSYINEGIKKDYTITDTSTPLTYNGSLLKKCGVTTNSIACKISFDIYIVNNNDQEFKCSVYTDIPLKNKEKSIYDGNITETKNTNFIFYRYK